MSSKLFNEFPEISSREWKDKVISDLKGADFDKKLVWSTSEGFKVMPYYQKEDIDGLVNTEIDPSMFPYVRGSKKGNNWQIRQNFTVSDKAGKANKNALDALGKGADEIGFNLAAISVVDSEVLKDLLSGISISETAIHFTGTKNPEHLYNLICNYLEIHKLDLASLRGSLGVDHLGALSLKGEEAKSGSEELPYLVHTAAKKTPSFRILGVNPGLFQDGGSSLVQELGFGLSMANE